jgi:hypothetical protein
LKDEAQALSAVLHDLEPADLARATNCPPWDLEELVVPIAASVRVGRVAFPSAQPHQPSHSAADYYRRPERGTSSYRQNNVDRTVELTRTVVAETSAVQWFDETVTQTIIALSEQDLDQIVVIPGRGAMKLAEWVVTGAPQGRCGIRCTAGALIAAVTRLPGASSSCSSVGRVM